jgi:hypothetical protein
MQSDFIPGSDFFQALVWIVIGYFLLVGGLLLLLLIITSLQKLWRHQPGVKYTEMDMEEFDQEYRKLLQDMYDN